MACLLGSEKVRVNIFLGFLAAIYCVSTVCKQRRNQLSVIVNPEVIGFLSAGLRPCQPFS